MKNNIPDGMIPFSRDEVKVGDVVVRHRKRYNQRYKYKIIYKQSQLKEIMLKRLNKNFRPGYEFWTNGEGYYIDRRPRYKRLISFFTS